jgi:hypothetical protein
MNSTAASVTVGQTVTTVPSIGSGRTTSDTFTVTEVETFEIRGHAFVELHHVGGSHTMAATAPVVAA